METLFIGKNIIFLPQVGSTNSYATDLLKNVNLPEGTVVHTAHQTAGRGQRNTSWNSDPASNLTASFILKPGFLTAKNQFFLYQVLALACYDAMAEIINSSQFDIKIKWPNDILVNEKKIAGILIENTMQHNRIVWCVAGVGINVNQENFEEGISAVSLKTITGNNSDVNMVLKLLCKYLEKYYLWLVNSRFTEIKTCYLNRLFGRQEFREFYVKDTLKILKIKTVGDTGLLVLEDKHGETVQVDVKEIKWLF